MPAIVLTIPGTYVTVADGEKDRVGDALGVLTGVAVERQRTAASNVIHSAPRRLKRDIYEARERCGCTEQGTEDPHVVAMRNDSRPIPRASLTHRLERSASRTSACWIGKLSYFLRIRSASSTPECYIFPLLNAPVRFPGAGQSNATHPQPSPAGPCAAVRRR